MRVYVLAFKHEDMGDSVEGVFSSYSAMITYLKDWYEYDVLGTTWSDDIDGKFVDKLNLGAVEVEVSYDTFNVLGEHSTLTNTLEIEY